MDEQNQNLNSVVPPTAPGASQKSKFWKFAVWFAVIVVVAGIVLWVADYFSPTSQSSRETQRNYELYQKSIGEMEAALRADTYGGATPQETLDLFITALRAGDVELASKYFALDTNTQGENYLTRNAILVELQQKKNNGEFPRIIQLVSSAQPAGASTEGYFGFEIRDDSGSLISDVGMALNKFSGVWKIQSL